MEPYQAPQLSSSREDTKLEIELKKLQQKRTVLERLLTGESSLSIAQSLGVPERRINAMLKEALEVQSDFWQNEAPTLLQKYVARHEMMYEAAASKAGKLVEDDEGNVTWQVVDINWFREMNVQLQALEKLLLPQIQNAESTKPPTILYQVTIQKGDAMYERAQEHLGDYADIDLVKQIRAKTDRE